MVRALLDGRKTQTRRLVKPQPSFPFGVKQIVRVLDPWHNDAFARTPAEGMGNTGPRLHKWHCEDYAGNLVSAIDIKCPYGSPGDRMWVKEKWRPVWHDDLYCTVQYAADSSYRKPDFSEEDRGLRFSDLCEQSGDNAEPWHPSIYMWREMSRLTLEVTGVRVERLQAISEADAIAEGCGSPINGTLAVLEYARLWDEINGKGAWAENPWVWVVEFKVPEVRK